MKHQDDFLSERSQSQCGFLKRTQLIAKIEDFIDDFEQIKGGS